MVFGSLSHSSNMARAISSNLEPVHVGQFRTLKMVGKYLIEQIKVPLAFDQNGSRCRVKFIQASQIRRLASARCRVKNAVGLTGMHLPLSICRKKARNIIRTFSAG